MNKIDIAEGVERLDIRRENVFCRFRKLLIRKLEPKLFERVTGLTIDDFDLLLRVGVFNRAQMNDAILKFRRYEDASLEYTGLNRHASDTRIGLMDSTVPIEAMLSID